MLYTQCYCGWNHTCCTMRHAMPGVSLCQPPKVIHTLSLSLFFFLPTCPFFFFFFCLPPTLLHPNSTTPHHPSPHICNARVGLSRSSFRSRCWVCLRWVPNPFVNHLFLISNLCDYHLSPTNQLFWQSMAVWYGASIIPHSFADVLHFDCYRRSSFLWWRAGGHRSLAW